MPLTATIIFEGDPSVSQKNEMYTMELPIGAHFNIRDWKSQSKQYKESIRRSIRLLYNDIHYESTCKVYLPGEKY